MSADLALLRRRAREAEFEVIEREEPGGLHVIVIGDKAVVHWWPHSRGMTAYVDGWKHGKKYATAKMVIQIATQGGGIP